MMCRQHDKDLAGNILNTAAHQWPQLVVGDGVSLTSIAHSPDSPLGRELAAEALGMRLLAMVEQLPPITGDDPHDD